MMDNIRRGCVTFGEVAWIHQNQQIQQEEGLSDFQDNATIGLGTDKNGVLRRKSCYQWKFLLFTYVRLKVTCTFFVCFLPSHPEMQIWREKIESCGVSRSWLIFSVMVDRLRSSFHLLAFSHASVSLCIWTRHFSICECEAYCHMCNPTAGNKHSIDVATV